jgi:site-specific DNA-methyltransferase (adenine-specific)
MSDVSPSLLYSSKKARLERPCATLHVEDCVKVMKGMDASACALVLADPPYEGVVAAEWDAVKDYMAFARAWIAEAVRVLRPGGSLLIYGSPERNWISRMAVMLEDEFGADVALVQHLSWVFNQGGGSRVTSMKKYAVQHEQLLWFAKRGGEGPTFNAAAGVEHYHPDERAVALAKGVGRVSDASLDRGRPPRSFLDFYRENSRSKERGYGTHPSMKPLALCEHLVKLHSNEDDLVFVPFVGSGSELLSAAKLGRAVVGAEINQDYVDLTTRRFAGHGVSLKTCMRW